MDTPHPAKKSRTAKKSRSIPPSIHRRYRWSLPEIQIPGRFSSIAEGENRQALTDLQEEQERLKKTMSQLGLDPSSLQLPLPENSLEIIISSLENHLRQWQLSQAIIVKAQRSMVIPEEEYTAYKELTWEKRARLWQMYVSLKKQHGRLAGSLVSDAVDYDWDVETAYASLLTNNYGMKDATTGSDVRNKHRQACWARALQEFYDVFRSEDNSNSTSLTWCPIVQDWLPQEKCCAAHIVPHSIGNATAGYMFGNPESGKEVLWDTKNGLWICKTVEQVFDAGKAVIIPLKEPHDHWKDRADRFKLVVLDKALLEKASFGDRGQYKWKDFHERELQFRNTNRPARRYLYFHFVLTMLRRDRYEPPGWAEHTMSLVRGIIWATPGDYLRRSMLRRLASLIGDIDPNDSSQERIALPDYRLLHSEDCENGIFTGIGSFNDMDFNDYESVSSQMEEEEEREGVGEEEEGEDEGEEAEERFQHLLRQQLEERERQKNEKKESKEEELMAIEIMASLGR